MSGIKVSERKFWELWPEVRDKFLPIPEGGLLRTKDHHCPITAVAALLGADFSTYSHPSSYVDEVVNLTNNSLPRWADKVVAVSDGFPDEFPTVARRLLEG